MNVLSRISAVTKAKMNQILDDAEDPDETFDYAFESLMQTVEIRIVSKKSYLPPRTACSTRLST